MRAFDDMKKDSLSKKQQSTVTNEEIKDIVTRYRDIDFFKNADDDSIVNFLFVIYLIVMGEYKTQKEWENFSNEIKNKSRFFPESNLLKTIEILSKQATCIVEKGELLYRVRDYTQSDFRENKIIKSMSKLIKSEFPDLLLEDNDFFSGAVMSVLAMRLCGDREKMEHFLERYNVILKEQEPFYGFDKINSDAPPNECAKEGRANPQGISYLYTAKDIKTAILESHPQMQKMFNICTVKVIKDARIYDFTYSPVEINENEYSKYSDLHTISEEFSKPNFGDTIEYLPTQFLCEYIRKMGFDGIKYKSSVSANGYNVLFFDTDDKTRLYDIIGSNIYTVNSIDIEFCQEFPIGYEVL